jgi:site-specific recombinase XerD
LKHYRCWNAIAGRVRFLREKTDSGRALSLEEEDKLLQAISQSTSAALYPFFVLSLDAGLRPSESRSLRRKDLTLRWEDGAIAEGEIVVSRSKTENGTGRVVPLTNRARHALSASLSRFRNADPDSYVFPFHRIGLAGSERKAWLWDVKLDRPMGQWSYKPAFDTALRHSGVACRFYDARHTFVTRLAENAGVSIETIRQLAGHVNDRMLARYAHIRVQARRDAIATLERSPAQAGPFEDRKGWAQNWAQSGDKRSRPIRRRDTNPLKRQDISLVGVAGFEPATTRTPSVATGLSHIEPRWEIVEFLEYMSLWMKARYSFVSTTNPAENVRYVSDGKCRFMTKTLRVAQQTAASTLPTRNGRWLQF